MFRPLSLEEIKFLEKELNRKRVNKLLICDCLLGNNWHLAIGIEVAYAREGNTTFAVLKNNNHIFIGKTRKSKKDEENATRGKRIALARACYAEPMPKFFEDNFKLKPGEVQISYMPLQSFRILTFLRELKSRLWQ